MVDCIIIPFLRLHFKLVSEESPIVHFRELIRHCLRISHYRFKYFNPVTTFTVFHLQVELLIIKMVNFLLQAIDLVS